MVKLVTTNNLGLVTKMENKAWPHTNRILHDIVKKRDDCRLSLPGGLTTGAWYIPISFSPRSSISNRLKAKANQTKPIQTQTKPSNSAKAIVLSHSLSRPFLSLLPRLALPIPVVASRADNQSERTQPTNEVAA